MYSETKGGYIDGQYYYKTRENPQEYATYYDLFLKEYEKMTALHCSHQKQYEQYFPIYHSCYTDSTTGRPYLKMDYIAGPTLEDCLKSHHSRGRRPCHHLTKHQLLHLFEQIDGAEKLLAQEHMVQLDLNPKNIIVRNAQFDITLIDFTGNNLIDLLASDNIPSALRLRHAGADLFARLFYSGSADFHYDELNHRQSFRNSRDLHRYYHLLDPLYPDPEALEPVDHDYLYYWDCWMRLLRRLL